MSVAELTKGFREALGAVHLSRVITQPRTLLRLPSLAILLTDQRRTASVCRRALHLVGENLPIHDLSET